MNWSIIHTAAFLCEPRAPAPGNFHPITTINASREQTATIDCWGVNLNIKLSYRSMEGFVLVMENVHIFLAVNLRRELIVDWSCVVLLAVCRCIGYTTAFTLEYSLFQPYMTVEVSIGRREVRGVIFKLIFCLMHLSDFKLVNVCTMFHHSIHLV